VPYLAYWYCTHAVHHHHCTKSGTTPLICHLQINSIQPSPTPPNIPYSFTVIQPRRPPSSFFIHSSSSSPSLSPPLLFTTTICTEKNLVEDTAIYSTFIYFRFIMYSSWLVVGWGWERSSDCGEMTISPSSNNICHATIDVPQCSIQLSSTPTIPNSALVIQPRRQQRQGQRRPQLNDVISYITNIIFGS